MQLKIVLLLVMLATISIASTFSQSPDSAFEDDGTNVLTEVSASDDVRATLDVNLFDLTDYIESTWSNNGIPAGSTINSVVYNFEHYETSTTRVDLSVEWWDGSSWVTVCSPTESLSEVTASCDLSAYINTVSEANDISLRWVATRSGSGALLTTYYAYMDYENITIVYTPPDTTPPTWQNQGQNTSTPAEGDPVLLYAQGKDETALDYAVLSTNETGSWVNYSGVYGSPMDMGDAVNTWTWSNFTWQNTSITTGTKVCWKIWYNDTSNNWNSTNEMCFTVGAIGPEVWTDKGIYNATETVQIYGTGFGNNSIVKLWIKDNLSSNAVGYPQNVSTNSTGGFSHSWGVNYACPGTYYITVVDQNDDSLQASTSFLINYTISTSTLQKTPDYAEDDFGDATTDVSASDDVYAVAYLFSWQQENYIYMNWSNSIPAEATVQQANITLEHAENVNYLYVDYFDGSSWAPACSLTISSSDFTETCDLTSFITTVSKANRVELRLRGVRTSSGGGTRTMLLDYALLSIYYNTTPLCTAFPQKSVNTNYAQYSSCDPRMYFTATFYNDSEQAVTEYATYELLNSSKNIIQYKSAWASPTYQSNFYLYDSYAYGEWYLRVKTSCYSSVFPFMIGEDGTNVWKINISFEPDKAVYTKGDIFNVSFLVLDLQGEGVSGLGGNIYASVSGTALTVNDDGNGYYSALVNTSTLAEEDTYYIYVSAYTSSSVIIRNMKSFYLRKPV